MRETLYIFAALLASETLAISGDLKSGFSDIDALVAESVKLRAQTARQQREWIDEKSEKLAELSALEETKGALLKQISQLEAEVSEANEQTRIISQKLARDESAMQGLEAFLVEKYDALSKSPFVASAVLKEVGLDDRAAFVKKSVAEKFAAVCGILRALKSRDYRIGESQKGLSTGIFVNASAVGKDGSKVVVLKVERSEAKK